MAEVGDQVVVEWNGKPVRGTVLMRANMTGIKGVMCLVRAECWPHARWIVESAVVVDGQEQDVQDERIG